MRINEVVKGVTQMALNLSTAPIEAVLPKSSTRTPKTNRGSEMQELQRALAAAFAQGEALVIEIDSDLPNHKVLTVRNRALRAGEAIGVPVIARKRELRGEGDEVRTVVAVYPDPNPTPAEAEAPTADAEGEAGADTTPETPEVL